jgi:prepilin-type processing-associated H-X9-DG protein
MFGDRRRGIYSAVYGAGAGFTLIELLIVVATIVLLVAVLLPALTAARDYARGVTCAAGMRSLGRAMHEYTGSYNEYIPGSPNTSGNCANPGGKGKRLYPGYYRWDADNDAWPAVHIFDWASPLLAMMQSSVPEDIAKRYDQSKRRAFRCPANSQLAEVNHTSRIAIETVVSSYATCRYFTYVPLSKQTGTQGGTLWWAHRFVPDDYFPRMNSIRNLSSKVFLADACKVDRSNPREISNENYGYTTHGAWLNEDDPENDSPSLSYRFRAARDHAFRHRDGLNLLFFDGHIEFHYDMAGAGKDPFGNGARQVKFWLPTGTDTRNLPNASAFSNEDVIVP